MRDFFTWRKVMGIIGLLIIGGVASSISDLVFKPAFVFLSDLILNIATLGLSSVIDGMYADVGKTAYERTGSALLAALMGFQLGLAILLIALAILASAPRLALRLKESRFLSNENTSSVRSLIYAWLVVMIVVTSFVTITNVRVLYTVYAASYIEQLQRIVAPKLAPDQRIELQSRVAQISTRAEYVAIANELMRVAETNKLYAPKFDIF